MAQRAASRPGLGHARLVATGALVRIADTSGTGGARRHVRTVPVRAADAVLGGVPGMGLRRRRPWADPGGCASNSPRPHLGRGLIATPAAILAPNPGSPQPAGGT